MLWVFIAGFIYGYIVTLSQGNKTLYLTNTIRVETKEQPVLYAILTGSMLILLFITVYFTFRLCFLVICSGHAFLIFGIFIFLFGSAGLTAVLLHLPEEGALTVIHVILIGAFFTLLGLFLIYTGCKGYRRKRGLQKKSRQKY